jgi:hypothetical protein
MTIITTFISPYIIKYGWRFADYLARKEIKNTEDGSGNN